jgi:hypothetical protein
MTVGELDVRNLGQLGRTAELTAVRKGVDALPRLPSLSLATGNPSRRPSNR